ncbi:MAG: class I SAM-dependent methyltransferase [Candidatus Bathyarchaeia archaeon]
MANMTFQSAKHGSFQKLSYRDVFEGEPDHFVHRDIPNSEIDVVGEGMVNTSRTISVPSYVKGSTYVENFGKQWTRFRDTQLDSRSQTNLSLNMLEGLLGGSIEMLEGKTVLEVGAGAGRFTEYLVKYADLVVSFDLSDAIFVNAALGSSNLVAVQADLWNLPKMKMKFDVVYCRGVLQHTPDTMHSLRMIYQFVKPGGQVFFDIYGLGVLGKLRFPSYFWRPIIQHVFTYESYSDFLDKHAERMLDWHWKIKPQLPGFCKYLIDYLVPVYDLQEKKHLSPLSRAQFVEWGKLDTLDGMFAKYDNPVRYSDVLRVLKQIGCKVNSIDRKNYRFRTTAARVTGEDEEA